MKKYLLIIAAMLVIAAFSGCRKLNPIIPKDAVCVPCQNKAIFYDKGLENAIRTSLNNFSCDICEEDLKNITSIYISSQVSNFFGMDKLVNLKAVIIKNSTVADFTFLNGLSSVYHVDVSNCPVASLAGLDSDANPVTVTVTELNLSTCGISDISGLSKLASMQQLFLDHNQVTSLTALAGMTQLRTLNITGNAGLTTLAGIAPLTSLKILLASGCQIGDISALSTCINLQQLNLSANHNINIITALSGLTGLQQLDLSVNPVQDITNLSGLTDMRVLNLSNTQISNIGALSGMIMMTSLNLSSNSITDITALQYLVDLSGSAALDLSYNNISDISALVLNAGIGSGDYIYLTGNSLSGAAADIATLTARKAVIIQ
jgi:internalin A